MIFRDLIKFAHDNTSNTYSIMKHLLSVLICLCLSFSVKAQNTYHSMLEGNPEWGYYTLHQGYKLFEEGYDYILTFRKYYLDGQKVINGKTYHCIYMQKKSRDEEMTSPVYCYGVREEAGRVYALYDEFINNDEFSAIFMPYEVTPDSEVVVYDFTKELNDTFYYYVNAPSEGVITTKEIKSIEEIALNDGSKRKLWRTDYNDFYVEGIGSFNSGGFLTHHLDQILTTGDGMRWHNLNWFKQNGEYVYKAPDYTGDPSVEEESYTTFKKEDPFLLAPVFEDGKTWNCEWWTFEGMTNPDTDYNPVAQTYFVDGDTVINNWNCYKLYGKYDKEEAEYIASYYDAGGKVYMIKDGETEGLLIYDFSAKEGDVVNIYDCEDEKSVDVTISNVMTVNIQGREAKCLYVETNDKSTWWIEGIGSVEGFEFNIGKSTPGNTIILGSCYLGDKCLYLKDHNNPNGIDSITTNTTTADSAIYDLTGRRLNGKPERGIYIQGGKKYVIK